MTNRDTGPLYTYKELCRLGRCHARIQQRDRRGPVMEVRASRAHHRFAYEAQLAFYYWILSTYPHTDGSMERAVGMLSHARVLGQLPGLCCRLHILAKCASVHLGFCPVGYMPRANDARCRACPARQGRNI